MRCMHVNILKPTDFLLGGVIYKIRNSWLSTGSQILNGLVNVCKNYHLLCYYY